MCIGPSENAKKIFENVHKNANLGIQVVKHFRVGTFTKGGRSELEGGSV